ncbi:MAG TPA: hypothetical protein VD994_21875 [Prosthecobacter sp.]|nr:hypothetical protein [Prosthecobacter sp.]
MNIRLIALILTIAGLGYGIWHFKSDADARSAQIVQLKAEQTAALAAKDQEMQMALTAQNEKHQRELAAVLEEHDKKLTDLRSAQRTQMATAFKEFENIFAGNRKTIEYINLLEGKVKGGQQLSKVEVEKLAVIASGLGYLQKQYQKPMQEFTALQQYFENEAARAAEKPKASFGFFKRVFSKNYREAEKEYYRGEGAARAFQQAHEKFEDVYASAQRSLRSVNLNADAEVKKLYAVIEDKERANSEDLSNFFDKARQALRTHQDVLDFEPESPPATGAMRQ